jgi:hypothetical protein
MMQGQYSSMVGERPEHPPIPPETGWLIAASIAFAVLIFGLMAVVHWMGKSKPATEPIPEPVRDRQEWAHYPQPADT